MAKTKTEFLQQLTELYRKDGQKWPASAKDIAAWAIRQNLWEPYPKNLITQCALEIAAAMREEHYTDPQGRSVRSKRAYRTSELLDGIEEQTYLWVDMKEATTEQAQLAFQYGRKIVLDDCKQLKVGVESYNDNNPDGAYIEISFNFTEDIEELKQPTEYPGLNV